MNACGGAPGSYGHWDVTAKEQRAWAPFPGASTWTGEAGAGVCLGTAPKPQGLRVGGAGWVLGSAAGLCPCLGLSVLRVVAGAAGALGHRNLEEELGVGASFICDHSVRSVADPPAAASQAVTTVGKQDQDRGTGWASVAGSWCPARSPQAGVFSCTET